MSLRRAAANTAGFLLLLVALDWSLGLVLRQALERSSYGDATGLIPRLIELRDVDVLVFGTSRAQVHVDTPRIERALGVSAYNFGSQGRGIYYARMLLALMLEQGPIEGAVVLQAEPEDLYTPRPERARVFAPYYRESPVIREILLDSGPYEALKLVSRAYRYNSLVPSLLRGVLRPELPLDPRRGYRPKLLSLAGEPAPPAAEVDVGRDSGRNEPDPVAVGLYRDFVAAVAAGGHGLLLFTGPRYRDGPPGPREARAMQVFAEIAAEAGVPYLPLTEQQYPQLADAGLYGDFDHLNALGAEVLTDILIERIRPLLRERTGHDAQ